MMVIRGVNRKQKKLLDIIWSFQELEDLDGWIQGLNKKKRWEATTLKQLVILATIDERVEKMTEFPDILDIVNQIY